MKTRALNPRALVRWALSLLILALLFIALSQFDARGLLESLGQISLRSIALLVGLQLVTQLLVNLQWHQIARFVSVPLSFRTMFYINCQGAVMDSITPGVKIGGEITRSVQISRMANCTGEQAAAVVALQKIFSLGAFFLIALFAAAYLAAEAAFAQAMSVRFLLYAIIAFFLLLFLCLFFMPQRMKAFLQAREKPHRVWAAKVQGFFLALLGQIMLIRKNKKTCVLLFLLSNLIWLMYPVKLYVLAVQFSPEVSIMFTAAAAFASYMVAMIPIFPGGLGGFESAMSALFLAADFAPGSALVITVVFRFVTFWFVMLLGMAFIGFSKISGTVRAIRPKA